MDRRAKAVVWAALAALSLTGAGCRSDPGPGEDAPTGGATPQATEASPGGTPEPDDRETARPERSPDPERTERPRRSRDDADRLDFVVTSDAFVDRELAEAVTCYGAGTSPAITFGGVPDGTVTLAVQLIERPHAVVTGTESDDPPIVFWNLAGIDPSTTTITAGTVPEGAASGPTTDGGTGFDAPCPPEGQSHTYQLVVFALSEDRDPPPADEDARPYYRDIELDRLDLKGRYRHGEPARPSPSPTS